MLAAVAPRHFVAVRYVGQLTTLYSAQPLTAWRAYNTSDAASRVSLHDDCFLTPYGDEGTFADDGDRAYLNASSAYTVVGGETCAVDAPNSDCASALRQLAEFHWSYLDVDYNEDVLSRWRAQGCLAEVADRLGYRYALVNATLPSSGSGGAVVAFSLALANAGFAAAYSPRPVHLVAVANASGGANATTCTAAA